MSNSQKNPSSVTHVPSRRSALKGTAAVSSVTSAAVVSRASSVPSLFDVHPDAAITSAEASKIVKNLFIPLIISALL